MTMHVPMIGRTTELSAINLALADVEAGHGRVITVTGDVGMGKTRLLAELANQARRQDRAVLWSQMVEVPGTPPYFLWMPVLRSCVKQLNDDSIITELGDILPDLAIILPELSQRLAISRPGDSSNAGTQPY